MMGGKPLGSSELPRFAITEEAIAVFWRQVSRSEPGAVIGVTEGLFRFQKAYVMAITIGSRNLPK